MQKTLLALIRLTAEQAKALADNPESLKGIIRATNGAIKCHVDIVSGAGNVLKVASNGVNPVTGAINLVSNVAQNVQLYKLQGTTNRIANTVTKISGKMDMVANLSWLNAGLSVVNIGATVISTEILCKKMDKIYSAVNQNQKLLNGIQVSLNDIQVSLDKLQGFANENVFITFDTYDQKLNSLIQDMQIEKGNNILSMSEKENIIIHTKALLVGIKNLILDGHMPVEIGLNMLTDLFSKFAMAVQLFSIEYYYNIGRLPANFDVWMNTIRFLYDNTMKDRIYDHYAYDVSEKLKEREIRNILTVTEKDYCGEIIEDIECQMLLVKTFNREQYTDLVTNKIPQCAEKIIEEMQLGF